MESNSQSSNYLTSSGRNTTDQAPPESLPIQPERISKVLTWLLQLKKLTAV